ncbi:MAG: hypothetical protein MMC33_009919, partial [Icmadophila ericetorum]|nr:hypothetical protein [Icmadophila ericetorum]
MRLDFSIPLVVACTLGSFVSTVVASTWSYNDATISIQGKGTGVGGGLKEKLSTAKPLKETIKLTTTDTLKIILTTVEGSTAKRAHQTFLTIEDSETGLETSYPFSVKDSGKGKLELTTKDIPTQLLSSPKPLSASIIVASFGSSKPYSSKVFDLIIKSDQNTPIPPSEKPLRYGKLPEIQHTFRPDPTSPPMQISMVFALFVVAALPNLFIV